MLVSGRIIFKRTKPGGEICFFPNNRFTLNSAQVTMMGTTFKMTVIRGTSWIYSMVVSGSPKRW